MVNEGYKAGIAKRSVVERLEWAAKGGPKPKTERRMSAALALLEARKSHIEVLGKLLARELDPADGWVSVLFAEPGDYSKSVGSVTFRQGEVTDTTAAELEHRNHVPVGSVIVLFDREANVLRGYERPFLLSPEAKQLLNRELRKAMDLSHLNKALQGTKH